MREHEFILEARTLSWMETNPATVVLFMQRCVHLLAVSRSVMMSSIGTENENVIGCKAKHKCLKQRQTGYQIYSIKGFIEKRPKYTHFVVSYKHLVYTPKGTEKVKSLETYKKKITTVTGKLQQKQTISLIKILMG